MLPPWRYFLIGPLHICQNENFVFATIPFFEFSQNMCNFPNSVEKIGQVPCSVLLGTPFKKWCVFLGIFKDGWTTDGPADQQTRKIIQSTPLVTPEILKAWTIVFPSLYNTPKAFGWNTYSWVPSKAPHPSVDYKIFLKAKHAAMRHLSIFIKLHLKIDDRICIILIECGIN